MLHDSYITKNYFQVDDDGQHYFKPSPNADKLYPITNVQVYDRVLQRMKSWRDSFYAIIIAGIVIYVFASKIFGDFAPWVYLLTVVGIVGWYYKGPYLIAEQIFNTKAPDDFEGQFRKAVSDAPRTLKIGTVVAFITFGLGYLLRAIRYLLTAFEKFADFKDLTVIKPLEAGYGLMYLFVAILFLVIGNRISNIKDNEEFTEENRPFTNKESKPSGDTKKNVPPASKQSEQSQKTIKKDLPSKSKRTFGPDNKPTYRINLDEQRQDANVQSEKSTKD